MSSVGVLIITHKQQLEWFEEISLRQCSRILGRYPMHLICPQGMDVGGYLSIAPDLILDRVDPRCLESYDAFNWFKIAPDLYRRFKRYEYLLLYELDAFVFRDELQAWCEAGWDYIGAPWFEGFTQVSDDAAVVGIGNGGFSLRRTQAFLRINGGWTFRSSTVETFSRWWQRRCFTPGSLRVLLQELRHAPPRLNSYQGQEDGFWCLVVPKRFPEFRIAPYEVAKSFSFEATVGLRIRRLDAFSALQRQAEMAQSDEPRVAGCCTALAVGMSERRNLGQTPLTIACVRPSFRTPPDYHRNRSPAAR